MIGRPVLWTLADRTALLLLDASERDAVLGDLAEAGAGGAQAMRSVLGLGLRRQLGLWRDWRPWCASLVVFGLMDPALAALSMYLAGTLDLYRWIGVNYGVIDPQLLEETGLTLRRGLLVIPLHGLLLLTSAWCAGDILARLAGRTVWVHGVALVTFVVWFASSLKADRIAVATVGIAAGVMLVGVVMAGDHKHRSVGAAVSGLSLALAAAFTAGFPLVLLAIVSLPAVCIIAGAVVPVRWTACALPLLLAASLTTAAQTPSVKAKLTAPKQRQAAQTFDLRDPLGKPVRLSDYKGRVLLLNFWATWCGGCKVELPWFQEFDTQWRSKGLSVVGIAMDDEGWDIVEPFIEKTGIQYPIALADLATPAAYRFKSMPATFLIDRKGRIAATYIGLVDRADIERNIRNLLRER